MPQAPAAARAAGFGVVDPDRLVEPGQLEDLAVVLSQAERQEALVLALHPDEQRDQQADAAAVHVVEPLKSSRIERVASSLARA